MKSPDLLLPNWFDRRLTSAEVAALSHRLADDPATADTMAELALLDEALDRLASVRGSSGKKRIQWLRPVAILLGAACLVFGLFHFFQPTRDAVSTQATQAAPKVTPIGISDLRGAPPVPRTDADRATAALDRRLSRQFLGRNAFQGTSLRQIAADWQAKWTAEATGAPEFRLNALGSAADEPLAFTKPAGSLRGLLRHAAALAGARIEVRANSVDFEPIEASGTTPETRFFEGDPAFFEGDPANASVLSAFFSAGAMSASWGLNLADFRTSASGGRVSVIATAWNLARLDEILHALAEPAPTFIVQATFFEIPDEKAIAAWDPSMPARFGDRLSGYAPAIVCSAEEWEKQVAEAKGSLSAVRKTVLNGDDRQRLDIGNASETGSEGGSAVVGMWPELSADGLSIDLRFANVPPGSPPDYRPGLATTMTVGSNMTIFGPYHDASAPPSARRHALAVTVAIASPER